MELFLGGAFQGKLEYVKSLYPDAEIFCESDFESLFDAENKNAVLCNFHLVVKNLLSAYIDCYHEEAGKKAEEKILMMIEKNPGMKIISDEIGSGIVPVEKNDRLWRELSGHLLVKIAERSEKVVRIICGIPSRIK